jgi:hypothetical protein
MENIINNRLEKLIPYLRGFMYDHNDLYIRLQVMIPISWTYTSLKEKGIIISTQTTPNNTSYLLTIGVDAKKATDKPIDEFLNDFEEVIIHNKKEEKKQKLLRQKIKEMSNLALPVIDDEDYQDTGDNMKDNLLPVQDDLLNQMIQASQPEQPVEFTPLYQNNKPNNVGVLPINTPIGDGIVYNEFDESKLYSGLDIVDEGRTMNGVPVAPREMFLNEREPPERIEDIGGGITYKPMPDLINNMRDNLG